MRNFALPTWGNDDPWVDIEMDSADVKKALVHGLVVEVNGTYYITDKGIEAWDAYAKRHAPRSRFQRLLDVLADPLGLLR